MTNSYYTYAVAFGSTLLFSGYSGFVSAESPQQPTTIEFDGSTGTTNTVVYGDANGVHVIDSADGKGQSSNLFHSFKDFGIAYGDTAKFTDLNNSNFNNVIIRVTGGNESAIYGNIKAGEFLSDANFFLLNPYGIVFGEGASVNIGGSFHASTADLLIFEGTNQTMLTGTTSSTFYAAPVEAFGFITANPAPITVTDTSLSVNPGKQISLIAGDITLSGIKTDPDTFEQTPTLQATDGSVQVASVAGSAYVPFDVSTFVANGNNDAGAISLSNGAAIDTSGNSGGRIVIRGGSLSMVESSSVSNNIDIASESTLDKAGIDIAVAGEIYLDNQAKISANSNEGASSRSSGIKIVASDLSLNNSSTIESTMDTNSQVSDASNYHEGLINIEVSNSIDVYTDSAIKTVSRGVGKAAAITLQADALRLSNGGIIDASAYYKNAEGHGGDISIDVKNLEISGRKETPAHFYRASRNTGIQSNGAHRRADTSSGNIAINSQHIVITDNGIIQANSYGEIQGGDINLVTKKGSIELLNGGRVQSKGSGIAGNISLIADNITISGATFKTDSEKIQRSGITNVANSGPSMTGNIIIESQKITLSNGARIDTLSSQDQSGGNIIISTDEINISGFNQEVFNYELNLRNHLDSQLAYNIAMDSAATSIDTKPSSDSGVYNDETSGGNIILAATTFDIVDHARISTQTLGLAKDAGNINIRADNISIQDNSTISTVQEKTLADSSNRANGNISIVANNNLAIEHSNIATTVNSANGKGGDIFLSSENLYLNAATLDSSANLGNGGNITIISSLSLITPDTIINADSESSIDGIIDIQHVSQDIQNIIHTPIVKHDQSIKKISACDLNKPIKSSTLFVGPVNRPRYFAHNIGTITNNSVSAITNEHLLQTPVTVATNSVECRKHTP